MAKMRDDIRPLVRLPATLTNALMETLGDIAYGFLLRIKPGQPSVLEVPASRDGGRAVIGIRGRPRWSEVNVEIVGDGAARTIEVWATAAENRFGVTTVESVIVETDETVYAFALELTDVGGTPRGAVARRVGTAAWDGTRFSSVTPIVGVDVAQGIPGEMKMWLLAVPPPGWMFADGTALTVAMGTTLRQQLIDEGYPHNRSGTDPLLPNFCGRSPMGAGTSAGLTARSLGDLLGEERHRLAAAENGPHGHSVTDPGHNHGGSTQNANLELPITNVQNDRAYSTFAQPSYRSADGNQERVAHAHGIASGRTSISIQSSGSGDGHNTIHPVAVVNFIVKI